MLDFLKQLDTDLFLFLNGKHNVFMDFVMYWVSYKMIWIPMYIIFLFLIIRFYKKSYYLLILTAVVMVSVTDLISVHAFKNVFQRLRPCHEPALEGLVYLVKNKCGGEYGFISSHAINHFAMAVFFSMIFFKKIRFFIPAIMLWAGFISYSRIYLGVHYPGDVICGGVAGSMIGFLFGKLAIYLSLNFPNDKYLANI